jgi:hypothetical protein
MTMKYHGSRSLDFRELASFPSLLIKKKKTLLFLDKEKEFMLKIEVNRKKENVFFLTTA